MQLGYVMPDYVIYINIFKASDGNIQSVQSLRNSNNKIHYLITDVKH